MMDNNQLIHIGSELVLFGGTIFYVNSQISNLHEENEKLKKELENVKAVLTGQGQALHAVMERLNMISAPISKPLPMPKSKHQHIHTRPYPHRKQKQNEETFSLEELDDELKETYTQLGLENEETKEDQKNVDCEEDMCVLKTTSSPTNGGKRRRKVVRRIRETP